MCGIVGYIGKQDALSVVISGLEKLEYRGYDSAGIAALEDNTIQVRKAQGKLSELKKIVAERPKDKNSPIAIGHTRWATHGRPSEENAHPHSAGRVSLIHNGIIENYLELRAELQKDGVSFKSETDTETAAHLLEKLLNQGLEPFQALKEMCKRVRGSYAFLVLDAHNPDRILVAKNATPIVIGLGEEEVFVASDIPAILPYTRQVMVLEDGDLAEIKVGNIHIENNENIITRKVETITWDPVTAQKGGFKHYMLKEIFDQVEVSADCMRGRVTVGDKQVQLDTLTWSTDICRSLKRLVLTGCGTAWHAGLVGKYFLERYAGIPTEVDYASEFRYRSAILNAETALVAISQSGETADTLAAVEFAAKTSPTLSICNVLGSTLSRKSDQVIYTNAGPEISVASTKAFTTQIIVLYLFSLWLGKQRQFLNAKQVTNALDSLVKVPSAIAELLKLEKDIAEIAQKFHKSKGFFFIARGACFPIALEGALKLKEISYIHAEGYPAGELKHGPLALIEEGIPVVVLMQREQPYFEKTLSNLKEVEARGGKIIAVSDSADLETLKSVSEHVINVPFIDHAVAPILMNIPLQLLAYHVAVNNGTDVDLPRNLAKSVTVE